MRIFWASFEFSNFILVAPRLRGLKQKKWIIHHWISMQFLLFYIPKPRRQVWIQKNGKLTYFIPFISYVLKIKNKEKIII